MRKNNPLSAFDTSFRNHWQGFLATYGGMRLFSEQLPVLADRLDEQTIEEIAEVMGDVFSDPLEKVRTELEEFFPSLGDSHLYPNFYNEPDVRETFATFQDTAFRRRVLKWANENSQKTHGFLAAWNDYMAQPPLSGIVLRQSVLINLVSVLEIFVDGLLKIYSHNIDSNRVFKNHLSWKNRWDCLEELTPSTFWRPFHNQLREIIARRNALIHQGGRITQEGYLKQTEMVCSFRPANATEGRLLLVPTTYLQESFDTAILFAFALMLSAWRAWRPSNHSKSADEIACSFIYQSLRQRRYSLVERLAEMVMYLKPTWKYKQIILVNWAIACREQSKSKALWQILERLEKRKKKHWVVKVAIEILRQHYEQAHESLKIAAQNDLLKEISPYWPLFDHVRGETWFHTIFSWSFGGKLPPQR